MSKDFVLVLNCGSSSIKFSVVDPHTGNNQINGLVECVGMDKANITWKIGGEKQNKNLPRIEYEDALKEIVELLHKQNDLLHKIIAVGHRVVHGGEQFTKSVMVDDEVLREIEACIQLAPLHNPANLLGIKVSMKYFAKLPQIAVFDTAFHQTIPQYAYMYALPYELYEKYAIRRYGFHGTSHYFVTHQAAKLLELDINDSAFISAHLGNGCSVCAVLNGKSVDTSMGLTPLEGLVMGTRSGDVDPGLHAYLVNTLGYDVHKVTELLNKKSGLLGLSELSSDMRAIEDGIAGDNDKAVLAMEVFCYRLAKYIMSYAVPLGRIDGVIFTGGIGENGPIIREKVLNWLKALNFKVDTKLNENTIRGKAGVITKEGSSVAIVVPTNEEWVIAADALKLTKDE
jgi:acetate kinase